jgi:hypothetical protein
MADESQKSLGNPIPTEGFPVVYTNLASLSASYTELRIYFAEIQPKTVVTVALPAVGPTAIRPDEANIAPRICMVLTPEFAKSLLDALSGTIALYEKQFGPLRPVPQIPAQKPATKQI